jgi:hypothetical protein
VETRCATVAEDIVIINNASAGESAAELSNLRVGSMQIKNWPCFIGRCYIKLYKNRICGLELGWGLSSGGGGRAGGRRGRPGRSWSSRRCRSRRSRGPCRPSLEKNHR